MFFLDLLFRKEGRGYNFHLSLWIPVFILMIFGLIMQFSVSGGTLEPWALKHFIRLSFGVFIALIIISIDTNIIFKYSWHIYFVLVLSLLLVNILGVTAKGSQRWLDLGFLTIQPSDIAKVSIILVLSRYFHNINIERAKSLRYHIIPILITLVPATLVLLQPDLGTASLILFIGAFMIFLGGLSYWYFAASFLAFLALIPIIWNFLLYGYQKNRILTLLNPESDPYGKGYQIIQSKISIGSGGIFGNGFLESSQSRLKFLPEKHTDFIFSVIGEELGLVGGIFVLGIYSYIIITLYKMGRDCNHLFGKFIISGFSALLFFHVAVNLAMVMGLFPVVGVPLPLISYGGSSILTLFISFALIQNVYSNKNM